VLESCGLTARPEDGPVRWQDLLRSRSELETAFAAAGFAQIDIQCHSHRWVYSVEDYNSGCGSLSRYLRWTAGEDAWQGLLGRRPSSWVSVRPPDRVGDGCLGRNRGHNVNARLRDASTCKPDEVRGPGWQGHDIDRNPRSRPRFPCTGARSVLRTRVSRQRDGAHHVAVAMPIGLARHRWRDGQALTA
jgi:hypothetical protein